MSKTLKQYVDRYVQIIDNNSAKTTIPPAWWVFSMWQKDEDIASKTPEETAQIIEGLKETDPLLADVIWAGASRHAERTSKQFELESQGADLFEIIRAGSQVELIPTDEARSAALALLNPQGAEAE